MPIRDVVHVMDEPDRSCPSCGRDLKLQPGARYSVELAFEAAADEYLLHLPARPGRDWEAPGPAPAIRPVRGS